MPKVQRKPPVFDSVQFTGGTANARTVIEAVAAVTPAYVLRYQPAASEWGLELGVVKEYKTAERIRVESTFDETVLYAPVNSWFMVDRDLVLTVISAADYTAQFIPA